jgi:hypothetical protein
MSSKQGTDEESFLPEAQPGKAGSRLRTKKTFKYDFDYDPESETK